MKKFIRLGAGILTMVIVLVSGAFADVIPYDLQWPLKNKGVADTSIFFNTEDAVDVPNNFYRARNCDANGNRGGSKTHFDRHAGHDIIANYNTPVYPVDDGYIVAVGSGQIYSGGSWKKFMVIEHENNGKLWTSVYWHLQNKGLIKTKLNICNDRISGRRLQECKVTKNTIIGYVDDTTGMNDVNHLHLGIRPLPYSKGVSQLGFGIGKNLNNFINPLNYLPHPYYKLMDDKNGWHKSSWKNSNTLDMYSGVGYKETMAYWNDSVAVPYHQKNFPINAKYKIYAKFPVSNARSKKSYYLLFVNKKYVVGKIIDQSDFNYRGHNVYLFTGDFKIGDEIHLLIANKDKDKYMSSDALLFIKQ